VARLLDLLRSLAPWALALVAATGVVALVVLARHRRLEQQRRTWARAVVDRVDRIGQRLGRPRSPTETPAEHAGALVAAALADDRLVEVAATTDAVAYGGAAVDEVTRRWVSRVLDDLDGSRADRLRMRLRRRPQR
jgi:hypothetical protein